MHTKLAQPVLLTRNARRVARRGCPGHGATDTARQRLIYNPDRCCLLTPDSTAQLGRTWPLQRFDAPCPKDRHHFLQRMARNIARDNRQPDFPFCCFDRDALGADHDEPTASTEPE